MAVFVYPEHISFQIYVKFITKSEYNSQFEQKPQCLNLDIQENKQYILAASEYKSLI